MGGGRGLVRAAGTERLTPGAVRYACGPAAPQQPLGTRDQGRDVPKAAPAVDQHRGQRRRGQQAWGCGTLEDRRAGGAVLGRGQASVAVTGDCY